MIRPKKPNSSLYIENTQTFRQTFLTALAKLGDLSTNKTGYEEIRELLSYQVQDSDRIGIILNTLSENNEHQKATAKKEYVKVLGLMAEILEDRIVEFLPKILTIIVKRLKENDNQLHAALSETMGNVIGFGLGNLFLDQSYKHISSSLKIFYQLISSGNKFTQMGSSNCIAKIIQSSPIESLYFLVDDIVQKLVELIKLPSCKSHLQLFECLLCLILGVEGKPEKLNEQSKLILPVAIENMAHPDWNVRKIAIHVIYTLSIVAVESISLYKNQILEVLNECRFDKMKNVRDIATTTIGIIKDINEVVEPEKDFGEDFSHRQTDSNYNKYESTDNRWAGNRQSPKRRQLEKNPNFFLAHKEGGDVEIYAKAPPVNEKKEKQNQRESKVSQKDSSIEIYVPNTIANNRNENVERRNNFVNPEQSYNEEKDISASIHYKEASSITIPNPFEDKSIEMIQHDSNIQKPFNIKDNVLNSQKQPEHQGSNKKLSPSKQPSKSKDSQYAQDFASIFNQLKKINKQQSTLIESITTIQSSTKSEIDLLKNKVQYLEGVIERLTSGQNPYPQQGPGPNYYQEGFHPMPYQPYPNPYYVPFYGSPPPMTGYGNPNTRPVYEVSQNKFYGQQDAGLTKSKELHSHKKEYDNQPLVSPQFKNNSNQQFPVESNDKVDNLLNKNKIREAYETCLADGDEETLLNLMKKTGVVEDHLHPSIIENIIHKLKSRLYDEINRPYILDWIYSFTQKDQKSAKNIVSSLYDIINELKTGKYHLTSRDDGIINQLLSILEIDSPIDQSNSGFNNFDDKEGYEDKDLESDRKVNSFGQDGDE